MTQNILPDELPIRTDLIGVVEYGAPMLDVKVKINTNENPMAPAPALVADIVKSVADIALTLNRYPDRDAVALRTGLADYINSQLPNQVPEFSSANIWAANGSNEILQQLLQAFGGAGRSALGFEPTYSMHKIIARGTQTQYDVIARDANFNIPIAKAHEYIRQHRPNVIFVCSPNNPTGTSASLAEIAQLYESMVESATGVLVVDEAYAEFSSQPSAVTLLPGRPRLIVSRTMSKAFAYAGARIGYFVADPAVVEVIKRVRLPYHLSAVTQAVGRAALAHTDAQLRDVAVLASQRDRIIRETRKLGYKPVVSDANFVLVGGFEDQARVWHELTQKGILVRDVGLDGYLRVTAGTIEETTVFLRALSEIT